MEARNPPARSYTSELLHEHFRRRARESPGAVALHFERRHVTFAELRSRVDAVSGSLLRQGIGGGSLVGIHVDRSVDQVAAMVGILDAGAAVVPLPPTDPEGRLREILAFGELDAVIDDLDSPVDPGPTVDTRILHLGELIGERGTPPPDPRPSDPHGARGGAGHRPAFVLSSSGSTGRPKMIVRSHASFFPRLRWTWTRHPFGEGELGCQKAHMTTTHALYELFEPLLAGAPTLLVPDPVARNLEAFWDTVRDRGVTRLLLVPSALQALLDRADFRPPPLKVLVLMGEYLHPELAARAVEAFPADTRLYSIYGSTEASSTLVADLRASTRPGEELPLGSPVAPDVRALVLDDDLRPVAPGDEGRLFMAGPSLFSGYWRDPERTESVLLQDPPGHEGPLYDTRDRVLLGADGDLRFRGRVDEMVKVRGFRVDLHEVERALLDRPEVHQAVVVVEGEGTAEAALVGFYAPASLDRAQLFEHLRNRLSPHMVPSALYGVDDFPRTASAKIDRLRILGDYTAATSGAGADPTLSDTERRVVEAWQRTLGHRRFGAESSFFEVGGTSLSAFALVHRLREAFGLEREALPEEALYRSPTVRALADHLEAVREGRVADGPAPLLVPLRSAAGDGRDRPPLFLVASAGGTLGAYRKLVGALATNREVLGLRDPFVQGERDPSEGLSRWVDRWLRAIVEHQPEGPYHLCAYSSAGALGYEIARRLREGGREVALLALVDPLGLDRGSRWRFGFWALRTTWMRPSLRMTVKLLGRLRAPAVRLLHGLAPASGSDAGLLGDEFEGGFENVARKIRRNRRHLMRVSALMELDTGLPFTLEEDDFADAPPERSIEVLHDRIAEISPEVDPETIERVVVQYEVQVRTQHAYRLRPYDGPVLLVEPDTRHAGILAVQLRPYVRDLTTCTVPLGDPSERERAITARFESLEAHYRSMRDERFVEGLAKALDSLL